jgi:membrane dipeptidase
MTAAMALAGATVGPKFSFGKTFLSSLAPATSPVRTTEPINDFGIVDLHCHPSLKMYLWNKKIWKRYHPSSGTNPFPLQYTVDEVGRGYVKGLLVAHYLVEAALVSGSAVLKELFPWIKRLSPGLADKVEHGDYSNFTQINVMMDILETQIHEANLKQNTIEFVIARDFSEFEQALSQSKIPIAHAIEGGHALGTKFPPTGDKASWYVRNVDALKARGVCLMSIGHIFQNDLAYPVEGISPDEKHRIKMSWTYTPNNDYPLTEIGTAVVRRMLDIGMIVDLTHTTPAGRKDVFEINRRRVADGKRMRPLTFTHTGAQRVFETHECADKRYDNFKFYGTSDEEIDAICECYGTIGIIPENYWLIGCDQALDKKNKEKYKYGIDYIVETIQYINSKTRTKNYDNISIGTDFDGFADAPNDLYKPSQLNRLVEAFRSNKISDENIRKITSGNALRLLRYGWGNPN